MHNLRSILLSLLGLVGIATMYQSAQYNDIPILWSVVGALVSFISLSIMIFNQFVKTGRETKLNKLLIIGYILFPVIILKQSLGYAEDGAIDLDMTTVGALIIPLLFTLILVRSIDKS